MSQLQVRTAEKSGWLDDGLNWSAFWLYSDDNSPKS